MKRLADRPIERTSRHVTDGETTARPGVSVYAPRCEECLGKGRIMRSRYAAPFSQRKRKIGVERVEVRMLQITVTLTANQEKVMEEARRFEHEGIAKIHEHVPTLILNVPDHRNEEKVIVALAKLAREGLVSDFKSSWVK
jgi:hypothetical protein